MINGNSSKNPRRRFGVQIVSAVALFTVSSSSVGCPAGFHESVVCSNATATPWSYRTPGTCQEDDFIYSSASEGANAWVSCRNSNNWFYTQTTYEGETWPIVKGGVKSMSSPTYSCQTTDYACTAVNSSSLSQWFLYEYTVTSHEQVSGPYSGKSDVFGRRTFTCPAGTNLYVADTPVCWSYRPPTLSITKPTSKQVDPFTTEHNYLSRASTFQTNAVPTPIINWFVNLYYKGGRISFEEDLEFTGGAGVPIEKLFGRKGGMAKVKASAVVNGSTQEAEITYYLTGAKIPDELITSRLMQLYQDGATPKLLTGITFVESTYQQFVKRSLHGISALWPYESLEDGGSHVGLMQMQAVLGNAYAWEWDLNLERGAAHFREKLATARRLEGLIRKRHPNLRELTPVERENMALVLWGPEANKYLSHQYYWVVNGKAGPTWVENTTNNPRGVAYAKLVRASCKPTRCDQ